MSDKVTVEISPIANSITVAPLTTSVEIINNTTAVEVTNVTTENNISQSVTNIDIVPSTTTVEATTNITTVDISPTTTTVGVGDASIVASSLASTIHTSHGESSWITGGNVQASFENLATTADSRYVNVTGDTMTGNLLMSYGTRLNFTAAQPGQDVYPAMNLGNNDILGVNRIKINDAGQREGVTWPNWAIFESPVPLSNNPGNFIVAHEYAENEYNPILEVKTEGIDVTGTITFDGGTTSQNLNFGDGIKARFGANNNLNIYFDGYHSYVYDTGPGDLRVRGNNLYLQNDTGGNYLSAINGGATTLFHNGNTKIATTNTGVDVTGTAVATTFSGDLNGTINTATTATTQSQANNSTKVATTAYVDTAVAGLVDGSPAALDTLNELAAALGDDANFSTTVTDSIGTKLAKASNLSDLTDAGTARTNLGLGTAATINFDGEYASLNNKPTLYSDSAVDTHLNQSTANNNEVLSWTGSDYDWVPQSGGIALTSLSVGNPATASGTGGIGYNNTSGVFTYTPPDLSSFLTSAPVTTVDGATGDITTLQLGTTAITALAGNSGLGALSNVDATTGLADGKILKYNGTDSEWQVANDAGGIALTDISVNATEGTASGNGAIAYNNSDGVFQYTPPTAAGIGAVTSVNATVTRRPTANPVFNVHSISYNAGTGVTTIQTTNPHGFGIDDHIRIFDTSGDMTEGDYGPAVVQHFNVMTVAANMGVPSDVSTVSYQRLDNTDPLLNISDSEGNSTNIEFAGTDATSVERTTDNKITVNNSYNDVKVDSYLSRDPDTLTDSQYDKDLLWLAGNDVQDGGATYSTTAKYTGQGITTLKKQENQSYVTGEPFGINGINFGIFSPHISKSSGLDIKADGNINIEANSSSGSIRLKPGTSGLRVERSTTSLEGSFQSLAFHTTDNGVHVGNDRRGTYTAGDLQSNADLDFGMLVGSNSSNLGSNNFGFGYNHTFGTGTTQNFAVGSVHKITYSSSDNNFMAGSDNRLTSVGDMNFCGGNFTDTRGNRNFTWAEGTYDSNGTVYRAKNYGRNNCVLFGRQTEVDHLSDYCLVGGSIEPDNDYTPTKIQSGYCSILWGEGQQAMFSSNDIIVGNGTVTNRTIDSAIFGENHSVNVGSSSTVVNGVTIGGQAITVSSTSDQCAAFGWTHTMEGAYTGAIGGS